METATKRAHDANGPSRLAMRAACPGSRAAEDGLPEETSEYAEEGTRRHEILHQYLTALDAGDKYEAETPEDAEILDEIITLIEQLGIQPGDIISSEQHVDLSHLGINGGGTVDIVIERQDGELWIIDLKTGRMPVAAQDNLQLAAYASGVLAGTACEYQRVVMAIIQPGIGISTWSIEPVDDAIEQINQQITGIVKATYAKNAPRLAGEHCRWCKARGTCTATADASAEIITVEPQTVEQMLAAMTADDLQRFVGMLYAVEARAEAIHDKLNELIISGTLAVPGLAVGRGPSRSTWSDTDTAAATLQRLANEHDVPPADFYTLVSVAQAKKLLPKAAHGELAACVDVREGSPVVRRTAK